MKRRGGGSKNGNGWREEEKGEVFFMREIEPHSSSSSFPISASPSSVLSLSLIEISDANESSPRSLPPSLSSSMCGWLAQISFPDSSPSLLFLSFPSYIPHCRRLQSFRPVSFPLSLPFLLIYPFPATASQPEKATNVRSFLKCQIQKACTVFCQRVFLIPWCLFKLPFKVISWANSFLAATHRPERERDC